MFGKVKAFLTCLALAGAVSAIGNARVRNNCDFEVTVWSVGKDISPGYTLRRGEYFSEQFSWDPKTGGRAIKITRQPNGLYSGSPQTVFAYSLRDNRIWYDLSDVFGDPFAGHKLVEGSADNSCPSIVWPNGIPPAGSQVKNCQTGADVTLTLCAY